MTSKGLEALNRRTRIVKAIRAGGLSLSEIGKQEGLKSGRYVSELAIKIGVRSRRQKAK